MSETVYCPVKDGQIDGTDCLIVCDVADRMLKPACLPEGIKWDEEQRRKCLACKYHADIEEEKAMLNALNEQRELLVKYLPDMDEYITMGDIDTVLDRLDNKITEIGFTPEYELNEVGLKLQRLYDELYNQN